MAINKRTDRSGKFQVKVRSPQGEWWTLSAPTRKAAEAIEREMQDCKARGQDWIHPRARKVDQAPELRTIAETFIKAHIGTGHTRGKWAPKTAKRYAMILETFCTWAEAQGKPRADALSRPLLYAFEQELLRVGRWDRARAPQTAARLLQCVVIMWRWADDHDDEIEGWEGRIPKPRTVEIFRAPVEDRTAPSWADMDDLIGALDVEWARRVAWIQRFTGARVGEVVTLLWEDLDLQALQLRFRATTTKGGYGGRTLPLAPALAAEIQTWDRPDEFLVTTAGARTVGTSRAARVFATAWAAAGVSGLCWEHRPTHALRAGVQTGLYALGAHRDEVRMLVGHQLDELRRRYIDPSQAFDLRRLVGLIPPVGAT